MKRSTHLGILLLLLFGLGRVPAFAQFSSGIEGTVHDSTGAVVAGAKVTATDTRLGISKETTTNDSGFFRIDSVAASIYTIEIQMTGFETWRQVGLTLNVGEVRSLAAALKVGAVSEKFDVLAT